MVNSVGYHNQQNNSFGNYALGTAAVTAGWEGETYLRKALKIPVVKSVKK